MSHALLVAAASSAVSAQELDAGANIRLSAEAVNNPYLGSNDTDVTGAVTAEARGWLRQQSELTSFDLSAFAKARQFTDGQDLEDDYGASAHVTHRASERLTLTGRTGVSSTASRREAVFPGLGPDPDTPVPPVDPGLIEDPTLLGQRGRTTMYSVGVGAQYALDERNNVEVDLDVRDLGFTHVNGRDYRTYEVATRLAHVVGPTTSVGADLRFSQTEYASPAVGDARIAVAMGSVSHRLDERWSLEASAGASKTRVEATGTQPATDSTGIAAALSLCRREERGNLCIDYQRQPQPTGSGGVRSSDSAGLSYDLQWSDRTRVAVGASYSRSGRAIGAANALPEVEFLGVRAVLERAFNDRVSGFVSASASRVFRTGPAVEPNVNVGVGVSIRLGRR